MQIGSAVGCSEFAETQFFYNGTYISRYIVSAQTDLTNAMSFQARYHQQMGITMSVMDRFVSIIGKSLSAHQIASADISTFVGTVNSLFYAGNYSVISATTTDCPYGLMYGTLPNTDIKGCIPANSASAVSLISAALIALFALLF